MTGFRVRFRVLCAAVAVLAAVLPLRLEGQTTAFPLDSLEGLKLHKVVAEPVVYEGRKALRVTEPAGAPAAGEDRLVILAGTDFQDGVIEVDLAGKPGAGAAAEARGFVGVAFRVAAGVSRYECFYLRPTNARAEDQVRRNHSVQYVSFPEYPWPRLRKESPEKYETYVDLVPGEWTKLKIEVRGAKARLYVHGAAQPTLLVNDLKLGEARGAIALWIGPGTEAYFASLRVSGTASEAPKFVRLPGVFPNLNPRAPLAAVLKFAADRPVETRIAISDGQHTSQLTYDSSRDPEVGLPVAGMRPGRKHTIRVAIRDKSGKETKAPEPLEYTTPALPAEAGEFPPLRIQAPLRAQMEPGFTVVSVRRQAPGRPNDPLSTCFGMILAIDADGEPVWYYRHDARISDFERGPNGNFFLCTLDYEIVEVDLLGNTVAKWYAKGRPQGAGEGTPVDTMTFHHEIDVLPNGNLVVLGTERREIPNYYTSETDPNAPRKTQKVMGDQVIEFQRDGKIVWQWNAFDHLDPMRIGYETFSGYWVRRGFPDTLDWSHANNLLYDRRDDSLLVSFRYQSAIVKIDRKTREVRWILGKPDQWPKRQQKLLFRAEADTKWFHHQHAPFPTSRGTILVFDNGNYQTFPFEPPVAPPQTYTRAVEYRLDEKARTVRQVWESETGPAPDSVVSVAMGNTEQLPKTGNVLVSYGALMWPEEKNTAKTWNVAGSGGWTRVREYTHTTPAKLVWEAVIQDPARKLGWQLFCGVRWASMTP